MGKTKHSKIALRIPTNWVGGTDKKDYQVNEMPKNKPSGMFYKYGVRGVFRGEQVDGHKSGSKSKKIYSRILRKKIDQETRNIINNY